MADNEFFGGFDPLGIVFTEGPAGLHRVIDGYTLAGRCVPAPFGCGKEVTGFRDDLSRREFGISGLCQECQDQVFAGGDEGDEEQEAADYEAWVAEQESDGDPAEFEFGPVEPLPPEWDGPLAPWEEDLLRSEWDNDGPPF